jgi:hypothetical protein
LRPDQAITKTDQYPEFSWEIRACEIFHNTVGSWQLAVGSWQFV